MQKIVLFIEPNDDAWCTPSKIGHLFMNRFSVDEDASFEIVKILELGKTSVRMSYPKHSDYKNYENERKQKGTDLIRRFKMIRPIKKSPKSSGACIELIRYGVILGPYNEIDKRNE